ncbi:nucleoid-associated protein [Rhizosphaericola mali]|uniref:Nucleoid-associated protein n=1 Tax=Rhizosphaericola mali TaxID=2545455 RepID=A0A5P2G2K0_9BACT|nr:hypothetical protein [Rhizosphaericola mali]QES90026.1 nucleoid-associated protein [Rhizosphaericola mali]
MIQIETATIKDLILHRVNSERQELLLNEDRLSYGDENIDALLRKVLLKPFTTQAYSFEFMHEIDLSYNVLFNISKRIFENEDFVTASKDIAKHLLAMSKHPNIKDGDLFIAHYNDIKFNNQYVQGIGIYKFEDKEKYIETFAEDGNVSVAFRNGISNKKPEKAVLILYTEEPYTLLVIDSGTSETEYWQNDFIKHQSKNDFVNNTTEVMQLTELFIKEQFPQEYEAGKVDQIDLLNRSAEFFKSHDVYNKEEYENSVLSDPGLIDSFVKYNDNYREQNDLEIEDGFKLFPQSIKKQQKNFKGIIKLDKDFHIYIHGSRQNIEQGVDENGKKFYKIYYDVES